MKRLIIADIKSKNNAGICTGHYTTVARNYQEILQDSYRVCIAGGPIYQSKFSNNELLKLPFDVRENDCEVIKKLKSLLNARELFHKAGKDVIILQQSTATTSFVAIWLFAKKHTNLFMIQYDLSGLRGKLHRILFSLAKKHIKGVLCPNIIVGKTYALPYIVLPDYIYDVRKSISASILYRDKKYDFCIIGRITEDKGVIETIQYFSELTKFKLLVAGKPSGSPYFIKRLQELSKSSSNIDFHYDYIQDDEYSNYIKQSRYAVLNYKGNYNVRSSGVIFDFIFNNVPVIVRNNTSMNFVKSNNVGIMYDNFDELNFEEIMNENTYNNYLANIEMYKQLFSQYISNLKGFIQ